MPWIRTGAALFALSLGPHPASAQDVVNDDALTGPEAVAFMVGCWAQPAPPGNGLREVYLPPASNRMTGLSQFWREGGIVDFEFHRIEAAPGGPVLIPHPGGVASVPFRAAELSTNRVVWENLEHDFPQRIIYHRVAPDTLMARIEGGEGDQARGLEWRMARTECIPPA